METCQLTRNVRETHAFSHNLMFTCLETLNSYGQVFHALAWSHSPKKNSLGSLTAYP